MPIRDFQIYGPAMVAVNFGGHVPLSRDISGYVNSGDNPVTQFSDLGLCVDAIQIHLNFKHRDIKTDAWGPDIPIDSQWMMADALITTRLVHWNPEIMELCLREAMGGSFDPTNSSEAAGSCAYAGTIMGGGAGGAKFYETFVPGSGYHYVSLNIIPQPNIGSLPWRFPASYLTGRPVVMPLGTERSIAECTWRAIPYAVAGILDPQVLSGFTLGAGAGQAHYLSVGAVVSRADSNAFFSDVNPTDIFLWDHTLDEAQIGGPG